MYEQRFPEVDDVVMVQVKSIAEMGAYVPLLEYHGIEGMILLSELSRRRIRSITKLIKVRRPGPSAQRTWQPAAIEHDAAQPAAIRGTQACAGRRRLTHGCALVRVAKPTGRPAGARHGAACGQREGLHRPFKKVGALLETLGHAHATAVRMRAHQHPGLTPALELCCTGVCLPRMCKSVRSDTTSLKWCAHGRWAVYIAARKGMQNQGIRKAFTLPAVPCPRTGALHHEARCGNNTQRAGGACRV